jgi:hypothetical protein
MTQDKTPRRPLGGRDRPAEFGTQAAVRNFSGSDNLWLAIPMTEFDFEVWQARQLLDECWRSRMLADQPPLSLVALAFKFMNATHEHMRSEIDRLRQENATLCREIGARRSGSAAVAEGGLFPWWSSREKQGEAPALRIGV